MAFFKTFALTLMLCLCGSVWAQPVAETPLGVIEGQSEGRVEVFKGIPYAHLPVGELRFAPPKPYTSLPSPFKAKQFCPIAYQSGFMNYEASSGLDSSFLCLNIYRPASATADSKLPVYVWIHGGSYVNGAGSIALYNGSHFADAGIVFVSINYRLGAEGFYSSHTTYNRYGTTGNWGHLDMVEALKWVKANIKSFGGDPDCITVGGESAGAMATSALILSPMAKGLFKRAILESGTMLSYPMFGFSKNYNVKRAFANSSKLETAFGADDSESGLALLKQIDPMLMSYQCGYDYDFIRNIGSFLLPLFDGSFLPYSPYDALLEHRYNDVDVLLGYNTDEGTMFTYPDISTELFHTGLSFNFSKAKAQGLKDLYPVDAKHDAYARCSEYIGDVMFNLGMGIFARELAKHNRVYMYHFDYKTKNDAKYRTGVRHASELKYAFGNLPENATDKQRDVSKVMHMRLVNFIKTGDPNFDGSSKTLINWPPYESEHRMVLKIGSFTHIEPFALEERLTRLEKLLIN